MSNDDSGARAVGPQEYVDLMADTRGHVPTYHKVMAQHDYAVLTAMNALAEATYGAPRALDARTKQLLWIAQLTVMRAGREFLTSHIQRALSLGLTPTEVLEAIELAMPVAGIVAFIAGFDAWREVTGAVGIEPTTRDG